ncbi:MAG TPA: styrene monooxygenase/indole monooxygenase family protein [Gaiellaceae bacterium]|nr:styrene monooxygenase/indole monooxygenase family protein [Gaiellaceae bacterium]
MRRVAVVGAGQSGAQLALGLLGRGYEVTLVSNRAPADLRTGPVLSSQCMFASALQVERSLGLDLWSGSCPPVEGLSFVLVGPDGRKAVSWAARLDGRACSVDQRVKVAAWIEEFAARGGRLDLCEAGIADLERLAREHELVLVATGKGDLGRLFERDPDHSPYDRPMRALALTYVRGLEPRPEHSAVCFNAAPDVGEYFVFPALTVSGPCEIMVFEGVPCGPMDCWEDVRSPGAHLARSLEVLERHFPWEAERARNVELTDANGILTGRYAPVVKRPVGTLPDGTAVLGMADAVVLNDPITGQGANNAAKCAETYLEAILEREDGPFTRGWMEEAFARYWRGYGQWVTKWTNTMLVPPRPHVAELLAAAEAIPSLAGTIANGFDDPRVFFPWWFDPEEAARLIGERRRQQSEDRFDRRALRRALGQYATGVTVVTTRGPDGRRVGLTANSFTSVSLDPPLVLFCVDRSAPSLPAFHECMHFAVHVLAADQHHLSRQFSTPSEDKFAGVEVEEGPGGVPLLAGVLARFVCRHTADHEAGDHLIVVGEVEGYEAFDGEPLVFHSGLYRVATRHPDIASP